MKCVICGGEAYIACFDAEDAVCEECQNKAFKRIKLKKFKTNKALGV